MAFTCALGHALIQSGKNEGYCSEKDCPHSKQNAMHTRGLDNDRFYFGIPGYLISYKEITGEMALECPVCKKWHKIEGIKKEYLLAHITMFIEAIGRLPFV